MTIPCHPLIICPGGAVTGRDWMEQAVCAGADPDAWFPEPGGTPKDAIKICRRCPVRIDCLMYASDINATHGIWGGLRAEERKAARP